MLIKNVKMCAIKMIVTLAHSGIIENTGRRRSFGTHFPKSFHISPNGTEIFALNYIYFAFEWRATVFRFFCYYFMVTDWVTDTFDVYSLHSNKQKQCSFIIDYGSQMWEEWDRALLEISNYFLWRRKMDEFWNCNAYLCVFTFRTYLISPLSLPIESILMFMACSRCKVSPRLVCCGP